MSKPALKAAKAAKACLDAKDWPGAEAKSREAISYDAQNYYAHVFLGLSLFNQKKYEECEQAYRTAVEFEVEDRQRKPRKQRPEAWQGLLSLYDEQKRVDEYINTALNVACFYRDQDERAKCGAVFDKAILFTQQNGTKAQYKSSLHLQLPGSPLFDYLEGLIPRPDQTYLKLAEIIEIEETEKVNKEIANRRSRLGAVYGQVVTEVRREVWGASPLEDIYQNILNWSDDEEIRRSIDSKLLQRGYDKLMVLGKEDKLQQRLKVENWARGLVILKYPFELAWRIVLEWKDCESIAEHDVAMIRQYIDLFPDNGLAMVLSAYLTSELSPFPAPKQEDGAQETSDTSGSHPEPIATEDAEEEPLADRILGVMIEGLKRSPTSGLCHRILAEYYLLLEEYDSAVEIGRKGQKIVAAESLRTGLALQRNRDALTVALATALIHFESPRHHPEAKSLFETVLKHNTTHTGALVGLGLILEEQGDYSTGADLLHQALTRDPDNLRIKAEAAWCNILQGNYKSGKESLESCLESCTGTDVRSRDLKAQILWRIGTALWDNEEETRSDKKSGPFSYFIASLQKNQNFAPAYTSLGIFYADIIGDNSRADKCFQRAFELSAGEVEAAERLARSFAEAKEWEFVGIIASRVVDADKKRSIPGKSVSWPHSALGVVELNNQNFPLAIQHFQTALRLSPQDFHTWIGLGEAYASSGRYVAALKVFLRAEALDDTNWFAKYMLANVQRETGEFEDACAAYRAVLQLRPQEFGVLMALCETLLSMAWKYLETGFYRRTVNSAIEALEIAGVIIKQRSDAFNLWKTIGDKIVHLLEDNFDVNEYDILADVDQVGQSALQAIKSGDTDGLMASIHLAILSYKRAIFASADDRHAHAVAWFNLGTAEYRSYVTSPSKLMKHRLAAIRCFKRTIKLEPGNHEFWNALGVATSELNPKVAQHAIVRALYINDKNARVWTNLGALYILQEDYPLANEAFSRAQSADPEYAMAWLGQGVIAGVFGEPDQAQELFQHSFDIADHAITPVKRLFATATFDTLVKAQREPPLAAILTPLFSLQKLEGQIADAPDIIQLRALFEERVGNFSGACEKLEKICTIYEECYEKAESEDDLARFTHSKADLARVQLESGLYQEAIENASTSLELSEGLEQLKSCRLSAHLTAGLAYYYIKDMEQSLDMFKAALTESDENPDVICLLSVVLWAKGGEEERDVARDQLFTSIEANPDHLGSMLLLGAIGVLDGSADVAEAVVDDLHSFRAKEGLPKDVQERIDDLLTAISQLSSEEDTGIDPLVAAAGAATSAIFIGPSIPGNWSRLAAVAEESCAAETALKVAQASKECEVEELSKAYAGISKIGCDQRAVFVAPWLVEGWEGLGNDVAGAA